MEAEAAWVTTTVIAAAVNAIRIDMGETPNKGNEPGTQTGNASGTVKGNKAKPKGGITCLHIWEDMHLSNICTPTEGSCPHSRPMQGIIGKNPCYR
jgi:hypothetical protein